MRDVNSEPQKTLKFRLGRKPAIDANRLPPVSATGWQDVEQRVVGYSLLSTGCYWEVKVAGGGGGGTVCSMVLEVVWFPTDTDGCSLDVKAQNMQLFPRFHLCSKMPGHCALNIGATVVHVTQ
eukprot:2189073-Amphidinium_carterae.2